MQSWTSTGYFTNSTCSSVTDCRFSPTIGRQGLEHPTRNKCVGWFTRIWCVSRHHVKKKEDWPTINQLSRTNSQTTKVNEDTITCSWSSKSMNHQLMSLAKDCPTWNQSFLQVLPLRTYLTTFCRTLLPYTMHSSQMRYFTKSSSCHWSWLNIASLLDTPKRDPTKEMPNVIPLGIFLAKPLPKTFCFQWKLWRFSTKVSLSNNVSRPFSCSLYLNAIPKLVIINSLLLRWDHLQHRT